MEQFQKFAQESFVKGKKLGFDEMEFFALHSKSLGITVKNQEIEETKISDMQGIGLRVIKDHRWGYAYCTDFSSAGFRHLLEEALRNSTYSDRDLTAGLPKKATQYPQINVYDEELAKISLEEKIELAKEAERYAKEGDSRVVAIDKAGYHEGESQVWIANTNGVFAQEKESYCSLSCVAIGEDGSGRDSGFGMDDALRFRKLNAQKVGADAAMRATRLLGAKAIQSMTCDVILPSESAVDFLEMIAGSFAGESVLKGRSMFPKLGEQIASPLVTIIDDGTLIDGLGSSGFDCEGVPSQRTVLVDGGRLNRYLYDIKSANEAKAESTGNGMRGTYQVAPSVGTSNYYLLAGETKAEEIVLESKRAVYVTEILGGHTANPISGDFSFGIAGFFVENGKILYPFRGATLAGNFKDVFRKIDRVGDDLTFYSTVGAPTIRIQDMRISG